MEGENALSKPLSEFIERKGAIFMHDFMAKYRKTAARQKADHSRRYLWSLLAGVAIIVALATFSFLFGLPTDFHFGSVLPENTSLPLDVSDIHGTPFHFRSSCFDA